MLTYADVAEELQLSAAAAQPFFFLEFVRSNGGVSRQK
jgi:hypothetical protein